MRCKLLVRGIIGAAARRPACVTACHPTIPTIGLKPVGDVAAADVVAVLDRVWDRPELARRTVRRMSTTMKWAMGRGLRETDPTAAAVAAMGVRGTRLWVQVMCAA